MNLKLLLSFSCMASIFSFASSLSNKVRTKSGVIYGTTRNYQHNTLDVYFGIPFAEPPVHDLRFKRPIPKKPWSEPLNATSEPAACVQYSVGPFPWKDNMTGQSEDCLYLNIWVPQDVNYKSSVIFWIYGGSYFLGSNRLDMYDARALATVGDVIVVTTNFRLGVLGFYYSEPQDAPGNVAIYDIVEALRWVHENIEFFGGDKDRITVYGASTGGMAAGLLTISPLSKGLFNNVIMDSGSPAAFFVDRNALSEMSSQAVANYVNCANDSYTLKDHPRNVTDCMRGKDALELMKAESAVSSDNPIFFAHYGDELLPKNPRIAVIDRDFSVSSLLIGNTQDEGSVFLAAQNPEMFGFFGDKESINKTLVNRTFAENFINGTYMGFSNVTAIIRHYIDSKQMDYSPQLRYQTYTALGDKIALCPDVYFAEKFAEKEGNEAYYYYFTHRPSTSVWAPWTGAAHYEEVKFTFGMPFLFPDDYTEAERTLSYSMIEICSNFSKHDVPSNNWPPYSKENPWIVYMDTERLYETGFGPHKNNCDFLRPHLGFAEKYYS